MMDEMTLLESIDMIQESEMNALANVSQALFELEQKNTIIQETSPDFVQEGVIGLAGFLTDKLPMLCDFFSKKFKSLFSKYKIAELRKENEKLKYQLDSQNARLESLERAMGGQQAVAAGGEVTFAYDYSTVTKLMEEVKKKFDKIDVDISDSALDSIANIIESASATADKAARAIKENKTVKMTVDAGSEVIKKGLSAVANVPEMIQTLRDKAVKKKAGLQKGKLKPQSAQTQQKVDGVIAGLTALLGKVSATSASQLKETDRVVKGKQRKVVSADHSAVIEQKAKRARESGDFVKEKKILSDDAKRRKQVLGSQQKN